MNNANVNKGEKLLLKCERKILHNSFPILLM